jgi:penicillin V acylase-like amidase (Ntn superfamily)
MTMLTSILAVNQADACSRIVYVGPDHTVLTGRTMDWMISTKTNLWVFPRGIQRDGAVAVKPLTWTSRYGSVISGAYDSATADGMNEKGLVANLLYLGEAQYPVRDAHIPGLSLAGWPQYVLDNYATVAEAVTALQSETFQVVSPHMPGGFAPTMHLSLSDASGDSAVLEYLHGKLVIHHGKQFQVMTNEPSYDQQLALDAYWKEIGGAVMLPGTDRPADRFVRASYYLSQQPQTSDLRESVALTFSIIRNVSVPMGVTKPGSPNIAPTLWRTVADQKNMTYFFESTSSPNVIWVDLAKLNFAPGQKTMKLDLQSDAILNGEVSASFRPATPFTFMTGVGQK